MTKEKHAKKCLEQPTMQIMIGNGFSDIFCQ
jgi:hypothetical protein